MPVPEKLKSVANSPAVQKAFAAFVVAVLAALGITYGSGCAVLRQPAKIEAFSCAAIEALEPKTPAEARALKVTRAVCAALAEPEPETPDAGVGG
jgi:hypothetical protein